MKDYKKLTDFQLVDEVVTNAMNSEGEDWSEREAGKELLRRLNRRRNHPAIVAEKYFPNHKNCPCLTCVSNQSEHCETCEVIGKDPEIYNLSDWEIVMIAMEKK